MCSYKGFINKELHVFFLYCFGNSNLHPKSLIPPSKNSVYQAASYKHLHSLPCFEDLSRSPPFGGVRKLLLKFQSKLIHDQFTTIWCAASIKDNFPPLLMCSQLEHIYKKLLYCLFLADWTKPHFLICSLIKMLHFYHHLRKLTRHPLHFKFTTFLKGHKNRNKHFRTVNLLTHSTDPSPFYIKW